MIKLNDKINIEDGFNKKFVIGECYEKNKTLTGKTIFNKIGENKITLGFAQEIVAWWTNTSPFNNIKKLDDESVLNLLPVDDVVDDHSRLFGFALSIDGGDENTTFPVKKYDKGYSMDGLLPFRMLTTEEEDTNDINSKYSVRHVDDSDNIYYYIKYFDKMTIRNITEDNNPVPDNPDTNLSEDMQVYSIIDLELNIDKADLAEYFALTQGGVNFRRYNGITLFTGYPVECTKLGDQITDYRGLLATNRMNIKQRDLAEEGKQELLYRIYI
ncbi:MAG: hypothetical protein ACOCRK_03175 [bacterium]